LVVPTLIGCAGAGVLARRLFYTNFTETFEPLRPLQGILSPPSDQVLKRLFGETPVDDARKATSFAARQNTQESLRFLKLTFWDGDTVTEYIEPKRKHRIYTESSTGREWRFEFVLAE